MKEILQDIKEYLKLNKDLSQLLSGDNSLINCFNPDTHRLHGRVNTIGAGTFRCTHSNPNLTQVPRDKDFRELLCVPKDKLLIDVDANALELVMLGHYLAPYDNYEFAKVVDSGDKADKTDIHSVNQRKAGLATRDEAKTFIYAVNYGAGATKIGNSLWNENIDLKYSQNDYNIAKEGVERRCIIINQKQYFPISKDSYIPYTEELILQTIYGNQILSKFKLETKGYIQLSEAVSKEAQSGYITGLDGRKLYLRSPHKALNLLIQSAGAIYMKYLLVEMDKQLSSKYTHSNEYAYVANIHDGINIEVIPEYAEDISNILRTAFITTSKELGLKYPVYGEPNIGLNQWETH